MRLNASISIEPANGRAEKLAGLRLLLPRLEHMHGDAGTLPFGIAAVDRKLPAGGLALDALHEIAPRTIFDSAGALAFACVLLARCRSVPPGMPTATKDTAAGANRQARTPDTAWLVVSPRGLSGMGSPHGHGLNALGLDPARLITVDTRDDVEAAWAMEEIMRSGSAGAVAGLTGGGFDAAMTRRLQLAASSSPCPLFLLRPPLAPASGAAVTRWRIGAAPGMRDRFGLLAAWRWQVRLERSRNGQTGSWFMEFDHATHRLDLAASLADPALCEYPERQSRVA